MSEVAVILFVDGSEHRVATVASFSDGLQYVLDHHREAFLSDKYVLRKASFQDKIKEAKSSQ